MSSEAGTGRAISSSRTSMRAFLTGKPCRIRNRSAIRPWQFVLEPLRGYLALAERLVRDPVSIFVRLEFRAGRVGGDAGGLDRERARSPVGRRSLVER